MTSIFKIVGVVAVVGVLFAGPSALATDFVWGCPGQLCTQSWTEEINWEQGSGFPDDANDNASITSAGYLIIYAPGNALTINDLTLAGTSPTKRKLHIEDGTLTAETFDLQDYAELDVDDDVTVNVRTTLSGSVWIDVADGVTCALDSIETDNFHDGIFVDGKTLLHLTTGSTGTLQVGGIRIDANAANEQRTFTLDGGKLTLDGHDYIWIESDPDADNKRAKLWLKNGSIEFVVRVEMQIEGGPTFARRAELDLDQDLKLPVGPPALASVTRVIGLVSIDIAAGKEFECQRLAVTGLSGVATQLIVTAGSGARLATTLGEE